LRNPRRDIQHASAAGESVRVTRTRARSTGVITRIALTGTALALSLTAFASPALAAHAAPTAHPSATRVGEASRLLPEPLARAARRAARDDSSFVAAARSAGRCLVVHRSNLSRCDAAEASLQRAGVRLAGARRELATVAARAPQPVTDPAPALTRSGDTLSWTGMASVNSYVLVRTEPGQLPSYSVLDGTSTTPPPISGATAQYRVRTTAKGSKWSIAQSITYPSEVKTPDTQTAPTLTMSGQTISWSPIAGVGTYILATTTSNFTVQYSVVDGTSVTVVPVAGRTSAVSIRTAVDGSAWSQSVTLLDEAFNEPFVKGINANIAGWGNQAWQIGREMNNLGVNWEREALDFSEVEPEPGVYNWRGFERVLAEARSAGITLLPVVGYAPAWTTPGNAAAYAEFVKAAVARFGPGTSANLQWWELWNEPYFSYAWSNKTPEPEAYARDVVAASQAARSVAPSVKLLISADYEDSPQAGGSGPWETTWIDDMFAAEPTLGQWINGVSTHPYGDDPSTPLAEAGGWNDAEGNLAFQRIDTIRAKFLAHGVNVPIWITEAGWSTWESSEAIQAHDYADLISQVKARPWIKALFPYCLREFSAEPTNNESGYGLLRYGSWQAKAAFTTLREGLATLG
jgi:hypothetical protein